MFDYEAIVSRKARQAGFSVIEVMVSAVLLGLGVMVLAKTLGASSQGLSLGKDRSAARQLALQRLETLSSRGPELMPACPESPGCRASFSSLASPLPSVDGFECTQSVVEPGFVDEQVDTPQGVYRVDVSSRTPLDPEQMAGAVLVQVSVCWVEDGRVEEVQAHRLLVPEV